MTDTTTNAGSAAAAAIHCSNNNDSNNGTTHTLDKEAELRIEVGPSQQVTLILTSGTAEIFGAELARDKVYALPAGESVPVFSWDGATLTLQGDRPENTYPGKDTPMPIYVNVHASLNHLREYAKENKTQGPRIMIVGPTDVGKSSLTKILVNYAIRAGHHPTLVDLDVGQNGLSVPGTVAATPVDVPILQNPKATVAWTTPVVYFYGHTSPAVSLNLYEKMVSQLSKTVLARCERHAAGPGVAGIIINTCGWVDKGGYSALLHAAESFQVDVMLVVGDERLLSQLSGEARKSGRLANVAISKLPKSGGVIERKAPRRKAARAANIRSYFYGPSGTLCPHQKVVRFHEVHVFRIGAGPAAPLSSLPIGTKRKVDPNKLVKVVPSVALVNHVLAISYAKKIADVLEANIAGFVCVTSVDAEAGTITCLAPSPGPLLGEFLIDGSITWLERS